MTDHRAGACYAVEASMSDNISLRIITDPKNHASRVLQQLADQISSDPKFQNLEIRWGKDDIRVETVMLITLDRSAPHPS